MKKLPEIRLGLVVSFVLFLTLGVLFGSLYKTSPGRAIDLDEFQNQLDRKEETALKTLRELREMMKNLPADSLVNYSFPDDDISYYVIENEELIFWSDNQLDISDLSMRDFKDWHFLQLPNASCAILAHEHEQVYYMALLTIKYNYPYENSKLTNRFARGFDLDNRVGLTVGNEKDEYSVFCAEGHYLFSLQKPDIPIYKESWSIRSCIAYIISFFLFFLIYARFPVFVGKDKISPRTFLILFGMAGFVVALLLYFNIPSTLFSNKSFTPFHYSSCVFLSSVCHLSVLTAFIFASVCLFFFHVNMEKKALSGAVSLLLFYPFVFLLLYGGLYSLVFHSSIQLNILNINDFSPIGLWGLFLVLVWGIALALMFYKTHDYFAFHKKLNIAVVTDLLIIVLLFLFSFAVPVLKLSLVVLPYVLITLGFYAAYYFKKIKYNYLYPLLWTVLYAAFVSLNFLELNILKNREKYKVLAQNVYVNGNVDNDRITDLLLEELDELLENDGKIEKMVVQPDSLDALKDYLDKTYFRGFWNKYDVQLTYASRHSELYGDYQTYIEQVGTKINGTHFYSVPTTQNAMTYIGAFEASETPADSMNYFLEFYPRRQYRSYSFPDLLIPASVDIHKQLNVSVAKYDGNELTYSSGMVDYPLEDKWIPEISQHSDYTVVLYEDRWHYIYNPGEETYIVVSKQRRNDFAAYLQFFMYLSLVYFFIVWLLLRSYLHLSGKDDFLLGLAARFQYTFIFLLILCFAGVFYFSVDFIKRHYQNQQIETLENKRTYIQNALQNMYYWNQNLDIHNTSSLNFDLQELSYTYQTDIHVFDNDGVLVGSSQPLIFHRNLINNRMSPKPYFAANPNIEQYEHIGELDYLVAYTDFYNGDYLQIGYIAVPQFLSEEDMRAEIENFSSVIIHIYLFIILLAVLLTVFVGRRLSTPLNMLERKLKEMRIGRRNEKIEYRYNDEIGQLVAQYNRTVDELEQSARLLAKSERESAWKSMARQIAHEINNPLTPMKLSIQQLQRRKNMADEGFDEYFKNTTVMLVEQIDNLSRIAGMFSDFARMPEANLKQVDVSAVLQSVVRLFANNKERIEIQYAGDAKNVFILADSEQLIQVFNNLIKNAIQAIPKDRKGIVEVSLKRAGQHVLIEISDNGAGVPKDIWDKMFAPNFTTKAQGMGLGLAISQKIIEQLGGAITFRTEEGKGSTFLINIPLKS